MNPPKTKADLTQFLSQVSGSPNKSLKRSLDTRMQGVRITEENCDEEIKAWMKTTGRMLSYTKQKALSGAMMNSGLTSKQFESFLLGWDMRGDDNVVEIKSIMERFKQLINEGVASQRDFKTSYTNILTTIKDVVAQVTGKPIPYTIASSVYSVQPSGCKAAVPSKVVRNIENLLAAIKLDKSMFVNALGDQQADACLGLFVELCTKVNWDAATLRNDPQPLLDELADYLKEWERLNM